jgi:hypothetical protein
MALTQRGVQRGAQPLVEKGKIITCAKGASVFCQENALPFAE